MTQFATFTNIRGVVCLPQNKGLMTCVLQRFGLLRKITPPFIEVVRGQTYTRPAQREVIALSRDIHLTQEKYRNFGSSQEFSLKVQLKC